MGPQGPQERPARRLGQLAKLHREGLLNEEELEAASRRLLDGGEVPSGPRPPTTETPVPTPWLTDSEGADEPIAKRSRGGKQLRVSRRAKAIIVGAVVILLLAGIALAALQGMTAPHLNIVGTWKEVLGKNDSGQDVTMVWRFNSDEICGEKVYACGFYTLDVRGFTNANTADWECLTGATDRAGNPACRVYGGSHTEFVVRIGSKYYLESMYEGKGTTFPMYRIG